MLTHPRVREDEQAEKRHSHEQHDSHEDSATLAQQEEGCSWGDQPLVGFSHCDGQVQG